MIARSRRSGFRLVAELHGNETQARRSVEPRSDPRHELPDGSAAVIAGHLLVKRLPEALDLVLVRAIGRQEVQDHSVAETGECSLSLLARVNDEVVEDDVNPLRSIQR